MNGNFYYFIIHTDAFDTEQLLDCIHKLKSGQSVHVPIYDFKTHQRCSDSFRQVLVDITCWTYLAFMWIQFGLIIWVCSWLFFRVIVLSESNLPSDNNRHVGAKSVVKFCMHTSLQACYMSMPVELNSFGEKKRKR